MTTVTVEEETIDVTVVEDVITLNVSGGASPNSVAAVASDLSDHEALSTTAHGGIVADSDSRLTDARMPTAHAASHATEGGTDPLTHTDIGADAAGSAATVQSNLDTHEGDTENPHSVTAAQAGADPAGSAQGVQDNLDTHTGNTENPHSVTYDQAGADPAGSAGTVNDALIAHAIQQYNLAHPLPIVPNYIDAGINAAMQALADAGIITYLGPVVMEYLLYDDFSVDRAVGTIDQTLTDPDGVGGLRTVNDIGGTFSIADGNAIFGAASPVGDSPSLRYNDIEISREVGRVLVFDFSSGVEYPPTYFGYDVDQTSWISGEYVQFVNPISIRIRSGNGPGIDVLSDFVPVESWAIVLRDWGATHLAKIAGTWVLLGIISETNSQTLWFNVANYDAGRSGEISGVKIPQDLWAPTPIAADTGTSADVAGTYYTDGGTLTGIEAGGDGVAWSGATWSNGVDGAKNSAPYDDRLIDAGTPFVYIEAEGTIGGGEVGVTLMSDGDGQNRITVTHDGTSCIGTKYLAGVPSNLFTVAAAEVPGVLPTASTRDNGDGTAQIWVWYDGAFIAEQEIADAGIVANTLYGEFSTSDTNRITNFTAYATEGHQIPGE